MNIRFDPPKGINEVKVFISNIAEGANHIAINAVAKVFKIELQKDQAYKFASRKGAYGKVSSDGAPDGYFSWKQFRYVAWKTKGFTDLGDKRTGASSSAWLYNPIGEGEKTGYITNASKGAYFTRSDYGQARQPANVGWKKVSVIIAEKLQEASRSAIEAVNSFLKSK